MNPFIPLHSPPTFPRTDSPSESRSRRGMSCFAGQQDLDRQLVRHTDPPFPFQLLLRGAGPHSPVP